MKPLRTLLFWSHLVAGVTAGLVILIMSVTGVILTYEKQIALWADTRGFAVAPPTADASRLTIDALLARVREAKPGLAIQAVTLRSDRTAPAAVTTPDGPLYVDPYSGAVLGPGAPGVRAFFRSVTNWHRWLAVTGQNRPAARAITGAANLLFLFIVCSGVYLWFPRTWTWTQFKQVLWFRRGLPGKARDFNWHNVIGFWSAVPLAVVVASGVVISYPWASNLVYRMAGETPPAPARPTGGNAARGEGGPRGEGAAPRGENRRARPEGAPTREDATPAPAPAGDLDPAWLRAERQVADWRAISLRVPPGPDAPLTFTIDRGESGQPHKRGQLTVDRRTGAVVRWEPFSSGTPGRQLRSILRFAHTGEVLGLAGQTVAGLVSAGGAVLVYTGLFLSFRRFIAWRRRRSAAAAVSSRGGAGDRSIGAAAARRAEALD